MTTEGSRDRRAPSRTRSEDPEAWISSLCRRRCDAESASLSSIFADLRALETRCAEVSSSFYEEQVRYACFVQEMALSRVPLCTDGRPQSFPPVRTKDWKRQLATHRPRGRSTTFAARDPTLSDSVTLDEEEEDSDDSVCSLCCERSATHAASCCRFQSCEPCLTRIVPTTEGPPCPWCRTCPLNTQKLPL